MMYMCIIDLKRLKETVHYTNPCDSVNNWCNQFGIQTKKMPQTKSLFHFGFLCNKLIGLCGCSQKATKATCTSYTWPEVRRRMKWFLAFTTYCWWFWNFRGQKPGMSKNPGNSGINDEYQPQLVCRNFWSINNIPWKGCFFLNMMFLLHLVGYESSFPWDLLKSS